MSKFGISITKDHNISSLPEFTTQVHEEAPLNW